MRVWLHIIYLLLFVSLSSEVMWCDVAKSDKDKCFSMRKGAGLPLYHLISSDNLDKCGPWSQDGSLKKRKRPSHHGYFDVYEIYESNDFVQYNLLCKANVCTTSSIDLLDGQIAEKCNSGHLVALVEIWRQTENPPIDDDHQVAPFHFTGWVAPP